MIQFYAPEIADTGMLPEADSAHCCRVLRMREGDEIQVVDGKGMRFRCVIVDAHPKHTMVEIVEREEVARQWNMNLTLAVAPTKHADRMEWLLEKSVEIGIDRIVMLRCDRSERKSIKLERLEKVMVSAMKQSLKARLPLIEEVSSFNAFVDSLGSDVQKYFGYCASGFPRRDFSSTCIPDGNIVIMIGPEGDFSSEEVEYAISGGFVPVTFGESRLRTETAALYAVTAVHVLSRLSR